SRRRHTRCYRDWSSDVCSSDLVEYVRRVYDRLPTLRERLCDAWRREIGKAPQNIDPPGLREIREAIVEINELLVAYDEFAGRTRSEERRVGEGWSYDGRLRSTQ